jgi:hypothetical protein
MKTSKHAQILQKECDRYRRILEYLADHSGVDCMGNANLDRWELALTSAVENGREEPDASDQYEGFLRMVDLAIFCEPTITPLERKRAFLKLPMEERRRIMREKAEELREGYENAWEGES